MKTVAIAGAGLIGRMLALQLISAGFRVTLFDRDHIEGARSCAHAGAGMLAPHAEMDKSEPQIAELGQRSLELWPSVLASLDRAVFFQKQGTLVVAHSRDTPELDSLAAMIGRKLPGEPVARAVDTAEIRRLEPELAGRFARGLWFSGEAQLEPRQLLPSLAASLQARGVTWLAETEVRSISPFHLEAAGRRWRFDHVVDSRGLGAKPDLPALRGVRGELIRVHAPEVRLSRPVRLMHPRYPLYIAPRPDGIYLIGATTIESEDTSPLTVRSTLELLSAAYSLHPAFAEAHMVDSAVHCRPALPDHLPRIFHTPGLMRINGLYRHGFLVAPALVEQAVHLLTGGPPRYASLVREVEYAETLG